MEEDQPLLFTPLVRKTGEELLGWLFGLVA